MGKLGLFSFVLLFTAVLGNEYGFTSCYEEGEDCIPEFRALLTDDTAFWYGTPFLERCPGGQQMPHCIVDIEDQFCLDPFHNTTLLSRLLPTYTASNLEYISSHVQLAHVTFKGDSAPYHACGHDFPAVPAPEGGLRVEPLYSARWNQARIDAPPNITWSGEPGKKYTVLAWDTNFGNLHTITINAVDDVKTGQEIKRYSGPKNGLPIFRPVLFIVMPQPDGDLDYQEVHDMVAQNEADNRGFFSFLYFANHFGFSVHELSASFMNVLSVYGDAYSAEFVKRNFFNTIDNCAYWVSSSAYLYRAGQRSQIHFAWSEYGQEVLPETKEKPHVTSLELNMEVKYKSGPISIESCCTNETHTQSQLTVDPFKDPFYMPELPVQLRNQPKVFLTPIVGSAFEYLSKKFTLIMLDFEYDASNFSNTEPRDMPTYIIHWIATDIYGLNIESGKPVLPYFGPNAFKPNLPGMYTFLLWEQTSDIDPNTLKNYVAGDCPTFPIGCQYRVADMLSDWGLTELRAVSYFFGVQDGFARQRFYREFGVLPKNFVCNGIPGYAEPCP